jgi:hypothetical protein
MKRQTRRSLLVALITSLSLTAGMVWAHVQFTDSGPDTCSTTNCNAVTITGAYVHNSNSTAFPYVAQVFTNGHDCVRIDVTSAQTDLEATLTCPNGQTWRNDNRSTSNSKPLIRAIQDTGHQGYCTLTISAPNGEGPVGMAFTFTAQYGRYNIGNSPNCSADFGGPFIARMDAEEEAGELVDDDAMEPDSEDSTAH